MIYLTRTKKFDEFSQSHLRGRHRGSQKGRLYQAFKSFVHIAGKYGLDPALLVDDIVEAWKRNSSSCGVLQVICRAIHPTYAIFLITNRGNVVSQFPITLEILRNPASLNYYLTDVPISDFMKSEVEPRPKKINELRVRMKGVTLRAQITEIPPRQRVHTRMGDAAYVSNVRITDETGSIRLSLWNKQIDKVHVGDKIEVLQGYVGRYAGVPQLRLRKNSTLLINTSNKHKQDQLDAIYM